MLEDIIEEINRVYSLEISLETLAEIYGEDLLLSLEDMADDVERNIKYLIKLGFGETVSDICNRFGPILCEDHEYFREKVDALITEVGGDYAEELSEDMSRWETLL